MKKSKSFLCIILVILMVCSLFAGCAKADDAAEQPDQNGDAADIPADGGEKPAFDKLEISMFNGGYGDLWIEMIALFQEYYPGVEVVSDLSADNATRVRARMLTNDPPDVVVVSGPDFNPFEAAQSGLYRPLTDLFRNGRTADGRNYADIINPSILNEGTVQDEVYLPPFGATYIGWWYDQTLFDARDWTVPESWDAFTDLSADIAAAGISPFVYAGIYPNYLINGYLYAAVAVAGGYEAYEDAFINLKEGAWSSDAVRTAITDLYDLVKNGYMYSGVTGIDHTQSQMEYLNGRAAFLPCGSWLETEMKDSIPDGFQMTFTPPPMADADGNHYLTTYSGLVGIPAKAKNPEGPGRIRVSFKTVQVQ